LEYADGLDVTTAIELIEIVQNRETAFSHERKLAASVRAAAKGR